MIKIIKRIRYQYVLFVMFFKKKIIDRASVNSGKKDNSIFFIFGSGRNGSTLLARLLNTHSQIFLPPEQFALPYTIIDWHSSLFKNPLYKHWKRAFTIVRVSINTFSIKYWFSSTIVIKFTISIEIHPAH